MAPGCGAPRTAKQNRRQQENEKKKWEIKRKRQQLVTKINCNHSKRNILEHFISHSIPPTAHPGVNTGISTSKSTSTSTSLQIPSAHCYFAKACPLLQLSPPAAGRSCFLPQINSQIHNSNPHSVLYSASILLSTLVSIFPALISSSLPLLDCRSQ